MQGPNCKWRVQKHNFTITKRKSGEGEEREIKTRWFPVGRAQVLSIHYTLLLNLTPVALLWDRYTIIQMTKQRLKRGQIFVQGHRVQGPGEVLTCVFLKLTGICFGPDGLTVDDLQELDGSLGTLRSQSLSASVGFSGLAPSCTLLRMPNRGPGRDKDLPEVTEAPQR